MAIDNFTPHALLLWATVALVMLALFAGCASPPHEAGGVFKANEVQASVFSSASGR